MKMRSRTAVILCTTIPLIAGTAGMTGAEPPSEEIAKLGNELTPLGAIRAGNADGTIPPWEGGLTEPPEGYKPGEHLVDPFKDDTILFTISAANLDQHKDKLSPGQQALLTTYPDTYTMHVYPTRRSAAFPQRIYDTTKQIAATARLTDDGNGVTGAVNGIPFPIPENGHQAIWNHLLRYRADSVERTIGQAVPTRGGSYNLVSFRDEFSMVYSKDGMTEEDLDNTIFYLRREVISPARMAGGILLVSETIDQVKEQRQAWLYNPGQRRVNRAPNVAYDNPGVATDGMRTSDQLDMYNGAPDRYDWKLLGRREMYVPYNSYLLQDPNVKIQDILTPRHINQDHARYELHRVWVVEATLKKGAKHLYSRRTFYLDEDSWQILVADIYDKRDQLWRVSEGHAMTYYNVPSVWTSLEVHTDLQAGRYLAVGLNSEFPAYNFGIERASQYFTPAALRRAGSR
jgi:mannose-6-phosphate isomerase-like protein (cupin superfamily)